MAQLRVFILSLCMIWGVVTTNATNKNLKVLQSIPDYSIGKIFFSDDENNLLFIDFEMIEEEILEINVLNHNEIMKTMVVSDLANDVIFEVDLKDYKTGTYVVEIVTEYDIIIAKRIQVKHTKTIN